VPLFPPPRPRSRRGKNSSLWSVPGRSPKVYELASTYQPDVKLATAATVSSIVQKLRDKAAKDLAAIREALKSIPAPDPKVKKKTPATAEWFDTQEKIQWLEQNLLPFLKKLGG
jgi:hypothetical protein